MGDFLDFVFRIYSTLIHLLPLRFHCVGRCWNRRTDATCALADRRSNHSARSHPHISSWFFQYIELIFEWKRAEIACWDNANLRYGIIKVEPANSSMMTFINWSTSHLFYVYSYYLLIPFIEGRCVAPLL
jgi:hypothetical protein